MNSLISILFIFSSLLCASEISFFTSKTNDLYLKSKSCDLLLKQREAICHWKVKSDESFKYENIGTCTQNNKGENVIKVSSCLPSFVKEKQNKKLFKDGANCWGTALFLNGLGQSPRFVWEEEIRYWQEGPLCRKLKVGEKKEAGDIINTYGPEYIFDRDERSKGSFFEELLYPNRKNKKRKTNEGYSGFHNFLHSEIFISEKISFGKESPNKLDQFSFRKIEEIYGRGRDKDCFENQSLSPHRPENQKEPKKIKGSKCDYFSIVYRCQNIMEYFKKIKLTNYELSLLEEIQQLQKNQKEIGQLQFTKTYKISQSKMIDLLDLSKQHVEDSVNNLEIEGLNKNLEMLFTLKYFEAQAIQKTFEQALLIPATELL